MNGKCCIGNNGRLINILIPNTNLTSSRRNEIAGGDIKYKRIGGDQHLHNKNELKILDSVYFFDSKIG